MRGQLYLEVPTGAANPDPYGFLCKRHGFHFEAPLSVAVAIPPVWDLCGLVWDPCGSLFEAFGRGCPSPLSGIPMVHFSNLVFWSLLIPTPFQEKTSTSTLLSQRTDVT